MRDPLITIVSYGDSPRRSRWWEDFFALAEHLRTSYGWEYTDVGASPGVPDAPPTTKDYRYSERSVARLSELCNEAGATAAGVVWAGEGGEKNVGARVQFDFSVGTPRRDHCRLMLVAELSLLLPASSEAPEDVCFKILTDFDGVMIQRYGLVHLVAREKGAGFYFADLYTDSLTNGEKRDLHAWRRQRSSYKQRLRDIYWGNLISEGHGGTRRAAFLQTIATQVGNDRVMELSRDRQFFALPFDIREPDEYDSSLRRWRLRLNDAFRPFDVLMSP